MSKELLLVNPRKRGGRKKTTRRPATRRKTARRRTTPRLASRTTTTRRVYRKNPIVPKGLIAPMAKDSVVGATGALALDVLLGIAPLPDDLKVGYKGHAIKAVGAIAVGTIGHKFMSKKNAVKLGTGALTCVMHDLGREVVTQFAPQIPLGAYVDQLGYYNPGAVTYESEMVEDDAMGAYLTREQYG